MIMWLIGAALAAGPYAGIPVRGVEGMTDPTFQTTATGWTAAIPDGVVRVFVGQTDEAAQEWVQLILQDFSKNIPPYTGTYDGEDLYGDGKSVFICRKSNVGFMVRTNANNANKWMDQLVASLEPASPWPAPPKLEQLHPEMWTVKAPDAEHVAFVGGRLVPNSGLFFTAPPHKLVAWDAYGRPSVWESTPAEAE